MKCDKLSGVFRNSDFRYKETIFIATGHLEVEIDTIMIQFGLSLDTMTLVDGRLVPSITTVDVDTDIDRWDIDIKIHGNIWSDFASAFEVFFVGSVVDAINDGIKSGLEVGIPTFANEFFTKTDGKTNLGFPNWVVDWETANKGLFTDTYLGLGVKGMFYDDLIGE